MACQSLTYQNDAFTQSPGVNDKVVTTVGEWILNVNLPLRSVRYVFSNWDELVHYVGKELDFNFNVAISVVWNRINWNRCRTYKGTDQVCSQNKDAFWKHSSFLDIAKVERVVNFYVNESLKKNSKVPEYKPVVSIEESNLIKTIAEGAGVRETEAREVMVQTFYAFADGQLPDDFITRPRKWMEHKDSRKQNENADSITNKAGSWFDDITTYLMWGGIIVGGCAVLYFTHPLWMPKGKV